MTSLGALLRAFLLCWQAFSQLGSPKGCVWEGVCTQVDDLSSQLRLALVVWARESGALLVGLSQGDLVALVGLARLLVGTNHRQRESGLEPRILFVEGQGAGMDRCVCGSGSVCPVEATCKEQVCIFVPSDWSEHAGRARWH